MAETAAAQLLAALREYRESIDGLSQAGWDAERYGAAAEHFERIRTLAVGLPEAHLPWIEVLISRSAYSQALWDTRQQPAGHVKLFDALDAHTTALERLQACCDRLSSPPASPP